MPHPGGPFDGRFHIEFAVMHVDVVIVKTLLRGPQYTWRVGGGPKGRRSRLTIGFVQTKHYFDRFGFAFAHYHF